MARLGTNDPRWSWELLWKDSQRGRNGRHYGHSFWRDNLTGKVSVKDMSGDLPHTTDDGVLWVDGGRPVRFSLSHCGGTDGLASLPVQTVNGERSMVGMRWVDAIEACRRLDLKVKVDPKIGEVIRLIADLSVLAVERSE
jgi:hypothetical protein